MGEQSWYSPTDAELNDMAPHVAYEIEQLRRALDAVRDRKGDDPFIWLIAEAGLIHARNLIEFLFYPSRAPRSHHSASARAVWYADHWNPYRRRDEFEAQVGIRVEDLKQRIDRRVCHLAVDRDHVERVHFADIGPSIDQVWRAMHANLRPAWRDRLPR